MIACKAGRNANPSRHLDVGSSWCTVARVIRTGSGIDYSSSTKKSPPLASRWAMLRNSEVAFRKLGCVDSPSAATLNSVGAPRRRPLGRRKISRGNQGRRLSSAKNPLRSSGDSAGGGRARSFRSRRPKDGYILSRVKSVDPPASPRHSCASPQHIPRSLDRWTYNGSEVKWAPKRPHNPVADDAVK